MHIIGTAGHVDHGKSSLVQALTGTNPDRWLEEQRRGMTLDLGFAHLTFGDGIEAGIVDVPGHERFLHNMLAGAAGMEVLLLVIDGTEGIRPQTVEHLQILQFLNVRETIVVLTKMDLVAPEEAGAICKATHEALAGTIAGHAPVFAVSSVTGYNLDVLKDAIHGVLAGLSSRPADAPAYLPVDRVFALQGLGTIVTGTLMQGEIATGDALMLQPSGKAVRVRSLQSFNRKRERVSAGARVAVNLPSVSASEISRGEMLVAPQFEAAGTFAVRFRALPESIALLRRRNAVRAYIGSAEILGTLVLDRIPAAGEEVDAHLFLQKPTVAYAGTAYVLRRLSPKNVLGGGRIAGAREQPEGTVETASPAHHRVLETLKQAPRFSLTAGEVARDLNLREEFVQTVLSQLVERGDAIAVARPAGFAAASVAQAVYESTLAFMREQQSSEPWILGVTSVALSRALRADEASLLRLLTAFAEDGKIAHRAGYFSTTDHIPQLSPAQQTFFDEAVAGDPAQPLAPVSLAAVVAAVKQSRVSGVAKAFDMLLAKGALVKVGDEVYRGAQIAAITARIEAFLRANERMTMAQFRDTIGTSRKYAVPLLEWFDARGVTVRAGDYRMLRKR